MINDYGREGSPKELLVAVELKKWRIKIACSLTRTCLPRGWVEFRVPRKVGHQLTPYGYLRYLRVDS